MVALPGWFMSVVREVLRAFCQFLSKTPSCAPRPESGGLSRQFERPPGAKTEHGRRKDPATTGSRGFEALPRAAWRARNRCPQQKTSDTWLMQQL